MSTSEGYRKNRMQVWLIAVSSIVIVTALFVAITMTIQKRNDRELEARIEQRESELMLVGAQIAEIKDHQFGTMREYMDAYARVEPLLRDYDQKLQQLSDLCKAAQQRDRRRTFLNMRSMDTLHNENAWRDATEIIESVHQINEVMKEETSAIGNMAILPEQEQVQFWHEHFLPLLAQEQALREKLISIGQKVSPERSEH